LPVRGLSRTLQSVRYHGANLFISGEGDGSGYHCANEVNFFFQVYGEKEWFFVHPRYTTQMDPRFTTPRCNYFGSGLKWGEHPRHVPIGRVLLQPGDVLINPPWWWHWVRNRSTSIGVATRWRSWRHRIASPGSLLTGLQWLFPYQWKIIWTDYVRGEVLNDRKWVHEEVPRLPGGAAPEVSRSREFSRRRG
ncbi:MAG: cupin-like domain-containing protein, partial [Planctomycetota bacterium]